jgi:glycosyltransferase involved in cell wall biosynthesis
MKQPKISVILPCYHVEKYLPNIHADLMAQTMKDFEVIYINDGGGGGISVLIHSFSGCNRNVRAIDKENGGVSSARNLGIDLAQGEWIVFVDPDDRLKPCFLQKLYDSVADSKSVVGIGGHKIYYVGQDIVKDCTLKTEGKDVELGEIYLSLTNFDINAPWNKIYKTNFLREHNFRFDENITMEEDRKFNLKVFRCISTVGMVKDCGYQYMMIPANATDHYHATWKQIHEANNNLERELLQKYGMTEVELRRKEEAEVVGQTYVYIINYFKHGSPLTLSQKAAKIREEIFGDKALMDALQKQVLHNKGTNRHTLCARLVVARREWTIVLMFQLLFYVKYHFITLFYWYNSRYGAFKEHKHKI